MVHPEESPRAGRIYHIVIYEAALLQPPGQLPIDEVRAIIALTREQVAHGPQRKPSIAELISEGAEVIALAEPIDPNTLTYPIGGAAALAAILSTVPSAQS